jgi:hypothetical protein
MRGADVDSGDTRHPARWGQQSTQHADERRRAGAVRAQKAEDLSGTDVDRDAVDGDEAVEAARQRACVHTVGRLVV